MRASVLSSLCLGGLLAALPAVTASAQTLAGTDNFNDNSLTIGTGQRWTASYGLTTTPAISFTETGSVLNFGSAGDNTGFLRWISPVGNANGFANNWTATINVTNTTNPTTGYVTGGFQIFTYYESGSSLFYNAYYSAMVLNHSDGGRGIVTEWAKSDGAGSLTSVSNFIANGDDTTDITLKFDWNASTSQLIASFSSDGVNFTTGQTFNLTGAEAGFAAPYGNGFGIEVFGRSADGFGGVSSGLTYDNMSVSAVPEPSTYAMIAGAAMLGVAAWRRRRVAS